MSDREPVVRPRRLLPLAARASPPPLTARLEALRGQLATLDADAVRRHFDVPAAGRVLKTTISLCPECLAHVPAAAYARDGGVWMRKRCDAHGVSEAVIENDEGYYQLSNRDQWGKHYAPLPVHQIPDYTGLPGTGCGDGSAGCCAPSEATDQSATKTCTVLVEVTDACNLACPVCYSDARGDRMLPLEDIRAHIGRLLDQKGVVDSVQLTGGEATLHPQFWDIVAYLFHEPRVQRIYVPTNGITFARPEAVRRLLPFRDKVMVLLQFDGQSAATDERLRDARLRRVRDQVLAQLDAAGVAMQLTMTLAAGVNLHEVGWVVDTALRHRNVRLVALQPATYSGRYDLPREAASRLTLSDVAKEVVRHARLRTRPEDFVPVPCSHPGCGWVSVFYRRFGLHENVVKYVDLARAMGGVANKSALTGAELRAALSTGGRNVLQLLAGRALGSLVRPKDIFSVAIKPFMDRFTYDQDRISSCCHHTMDTHGSLVSFCEYNALLRPHDSWARLPALPRA
jgi:uncharacterized radical SAM superfamily Fe-S cluster-containing enzyme